jgi:hypothetical protein
MSLDWTNAEAADGPKLAEWLEDGRMPPPRRWTEEDSLPQNLRRRVTAWKTGEQASFGCVDKYLTFLGYHVSELPDDVWVPKHPRVTKQGHPAEVRERALTLLREDPSCRRVGRKIGVSERSVRSWARKAGVPYSTQHSRPPRVAA